jgi:uncharacterized protein (TIGR04551 family)
MICARALAAFLLLLVCLPSGARAQGREASILVPRATFVDFQLEGQFRWRTEVSTGLPLDSLEDGQFGTPVQTYDNGANLGASGNPWREVSDFRLRVKPTLGLGDMLTVNGWFDVAGGIAGASPAADPLLVSTGVLSPWARPSTGSGGDYLNSISVRALYADLNLFNFVGIRLGRIPCHWGLGILENDGREDFADYGTFIDSFEFSAAPVDDIRLSLSWDFPLEGKQVAATSTRPYSAYIDSGDMDEVYQFRFKASSTRDGTPGAGPGLSWGAMASLRWQDFSSAAQQISGDPACKPDAGGNLPFACTELFYRSAFLFTPDAWVAWSAHLWGGTLGVAAEASALLGDISATQRLSLNDSSKDFASAGGAARLTWEDPLTRVEFLTALASGDGDADAFGVQDTWQISTPDDSAWQGSRIAANTTVTAHLLNPAFLPDSLLYSRVIGTITSSAMLRTSYERALWGTRQWGLYTQGSLLYAAAFADAQTPGQGNSLGLEGSAAAGLRYRGARLELRALGLLPLAGLETSTSAQATWMLRGSLLIDF